MTGDVGGDRGRGVRLTRHTRVQAQKERHRSSRAGPFASCGVDGSGRKDAEETVLFSLDSLD